MRLRRLLTVTLFVLATILPVAATTASAAAVARPPVAGPNARPENTVFWTVYNACTGVGGPPGGCATVAGVAAFIAALAGMG